MSIQAQLNQMLFDKLPQVRDYIRTLSGQDRDNAVAITLRRAMNSDIAVDHMLDWQLIMFEDCLLKDLKRKVTSAA